MQSSPVQTSPEDFTTSHGLGKCPQGILVDISSGETPLLLQLYNDFIHEAG